MTSATSRAVDAAGPNDLWHARPVAELLDRFGTDAARGLGADEAVARLAADGRNEIDRSETASPFLLLASQFHSLIIWVLIGAAVVSAALGEIVDAVAILAIVVLNALVGFIQEYRAERAVAALRELVAPRAKVVRDGLAAVIPAAEVVRGDVILLEGGDLIAADARLIETHALRTVESSLTGESEPVEKSDAVAPADAALADRSNMVFLGTAVASGTGRAVAVATGMRTEVGHIAALLERESREPTPLQRQLDRVGRRLLWACLAIVALVFVVGLWREMPPFDLFLAAVSLAVAAVPEGLPAVVTLALALGVQRMARRNALTRRLASVETLGCTQVICADKTGTLTVGEMTVRKLVLADAVFTCTGEGYAPGGSIVADAGGGAGAEADLREQLVAAAACNDAEWRADGAAAQAVGDPTEIALLVAAAKRGITRARIDLELPRLHALPFDANRKRMTVVRGRRGGVWAAVKGAPEEIIGRCSAIRVDGAERPITEAQRASLLEAAAVLASDALRVLAFAARQFDAAGAEDGEFENGLTLLGLAGMQDPPRPEARAAVRRCQRAGIRVVMITGDHPATARAIARELGILSGSDASAVVSGPDLDRMDEPMLTARVGKIGVYARVTAEHKLRIVQAFKAGGTVVAMTGDGVNDAPALKEASIGIAMGLTGTEVTKEAADMVVADDNFASIVAAVEEGRGIYDNIAKTLAYLLTGNVGELIVMLAAAVLGWPLPLLPIHLLWINLVTDGLPALALATDPIDPRVLAQPPRDPRAALADRAFMVRALLTGCLTATVTLAAFAHALHSAAGAEAARNAAFSVLVFEELLRSLSARSATRTIWSLGVFSNLPLLAVVAGSVGLQLAILHVEALRAVFQTQPVSLETLLAWIALAALPSLVLEIAKLFRTVTAGGPGTRPIPIGPR
jgi:Ca2+-transporting ATPase